MGIEQGFALVGVVYLIACNANRVGIVRAGRALAREVERRYPDIYEEAGRPWPTYLDSLRGSAFVRYLAQRHHLTLPDPELARRFEEHRRRETRFVVIALVGLAVLCSSGLYVESLG